MAEAVLTAKKPEEEGKLGEKKRIEKLALAIGDPKKGIKQKR